MKWWLLAILAVGIGIVLFGLPGLTVRERNLLALLREGRSNAQIAFQLGIAEKTVRNHFSNLYRKLGVRSRVEALLHTRPGA